MRTSTSCSGTRSRRRSASTRADPSAASAGDSLLGKPSVAIVGAGIGGLTCAVALRRLGFEARVYEQAPALAKVGAGMGLWCGAVRALREIGVAPSFWSMPRCWFERTELATPDGRVLTGFDVTAMTRGAPSFVVHRAELHAALAAELDPASIALGARCVGVEQNADGATVRFADDTAERADLVIGADGLRSAVRTAVFGAEPPRYGGEACYRGVAPVALAEPGLVREVQGAGQRCAVHALDRERVYWWATRRVPEGGSEPPAERKAVLARCFAGWAFGFPEALAATPADAILRNDLYDRPPQRTWSAGRVTLLGDAAHPTTPNLGLGGCMAIEDGLVLARALAEQDGDGPRAFARYERERMARANAATRASRAFGRLGSFESALAIRARELVTAAVPKRMLARTFRTQVGYEPGPLRRAPPVG
jgi:2-polyprenyl-6-methoxyphenol hydroxylase-like FAD-dependent oxidoreductase